MSTETSNAEIVKAVPMVFEIPENNFPKLIAAFDKMTKRARKCKLAAPRFEIIH